MCDISRFLFRIGKYTSCYRTHPIERPVFEPLDRKLPACRVSNVSKQGFPFGRIDTGPEVQFPNLNAIGMHVQKGIVRFRSNDVMPEIKGRTISAYLERSARECTIMYFNAVNFIVPIMMLPESA